MKMKKPISKKKSVTRGISKKKGRSQSAPPQGGESIGSIRSMMQKLDSKLSSYPKGSFANKGEQMGARFGTLGALAGRGLGAGLSAISGYGNYTVKKNSLTKVSASVDMVPQFVKNEHSVRVVHREFIQDIAVPANGAAFNMLYAQKINPGNSVMFPWLSRMAKQYSQYKLHGMVFAFKTMTSDYAANGPLGTVMMATNYDAIERVYANKIELENSEFAVSCKPSESLIHAIECDPKYSTLDMLYIRDSSYDTSETDDRRFYDFGTVQFATSGLPGALGSVMGEFWVSYDIELCKPIAGGETTTLVPANTVISQPTGVLGVGTTSRPLNFYWTGNSYNPAAGEIVPINPTLGSILIYGGDTQAIGPVIDLSGNSLLLRKAGKYIITWSMTAPSNNSNSYQLAAGASTSTSCAPGFTTYGSASYTCTTPFQSVYGGNEIGYVPNGNYTASGRVSYSGTATVTVSGVPPDSNLNYVVVQSPSFVAASSLLVTALTRRVQVEYVAFGTNNQQTAYTPDRKSVV